MPSPWAEIVTCVCAYLAGSIPFGLLTARFAANIDIRKEGSGNIGASNVGRILGAKWGAFVLVLDALKGLLPVLLLPMLFLSKEPGEAHLIHVLTGICTVVGHMFPVWLKFRGGKGVATSLGVVLVLAPLGSLAALGGFVLCMLASRIVALSSMIAAVVFGIGQLLILSPNPFDREKLPLSIFSLVAPALIILRHRSNIGRILRGEEKKFTFGGRGKESTDSATETDSGTNLDASIESASDTASAGGAAEGE